LELKELNLGELKMEELEMKELNLEQWLEIGGEGAWPPVVGLATHVGANLHPWESG